MAEKLTVQSVTDLITSKAGNQYFTFEDLAQKRYVCYNPKLRDYCKVGSEIEADLTPGKTPEDSPRLDMVYVNGKPVISVEKKTAGRSYGKSKEELAQQKQLAEAQNRSIQAQTALNRAVDIGIATDPSISQIKEDAKEFYQLLQSLTQISEAKIIHKEIKDVSDKVSTEKTRRGSGEEAGQGSGEFDEKWWLKAIKTLGKGWIAEQLKLFDITLVEGQLLIKTIKEMEPSKRGLLKNGVELALAYKEKQ